MENGDHANKIMDMNKSTKMLRSKLNFDIELG